MKVKVKGEEVALQPLKGRVAKKIRSMMFEVMKTTEDADQADKAQELLDYIDEEAAKLVNMTVEQLDELDVDEKDAITGYIVRKVEAGLDFLRSSSPQRSSLSKDMTQ